MEIEKIKELHERMEKLKKEMETARKELQKTLAEVFPKLTIRERIELYFHLYPKKDVTISELRKFTEYAGGYISFVCEEFVRRGKLKRVRPGVYRLA